MNSEIKNSTSPWFLFYPLHRIQACFYRLSRSAFSDLHREANPEIPEMEVCMDYRHLLYSFMTHTFQPWLYRVFEERELQPFVDHLANFRGLEVCIVKAGESRFDEKDIIETYEYLMEHRGLAFVIYDPYNNVIRNANGTLRYFKDI